MVRRKMTVMIALFTMFLFGGLVQEGQAVEAVTKTNIVKTVYKVENLVRIADNVVILFDSSGSMGKTFDDSGVTKLQAAKKIVMQRAASFPDVFPELKVGLYSYTPPAKAVPGVDTSVLYKLQPFNKAGFLKAAEQLPDEASGPTLMVNAMRKLGSLLDELSGRTVVFLFTDGTHSDAGASEGPLVLAQKIAKSHDVDFQIISTTTVKKQIKLMETVASINEASRVHTFENLLSRPEIFTGSVFALEESYVVTAEAQNEIVGFKLDHVLFGFNKSEVKVEFTDELNTVGEILQKNPDSYIVLAGHTDSAGDEEYNLALSHQRVEAVGAYLAEKFHIDSNRISLFWYGEAAPAVSNDTAEGRQQNRRVVGFIAGVN
ncbi:MAG: OmpA family protein [Desulfuromonadales bacterium]|nr:OmpA family protein [Desulfuromonadales bacterium]